MSNARDKAIEAVEGYLLKEIGHCFTNHTVAERLCKAVTPDAIAAFEATMLEHGQKMTPRETTDDMVRAEAAKMSAPLDYMKRKWAAIWDAAPSSGGGSAAP